MSAPVRNNLADVDNVTFGELERQERPRVCPDWRKEQVTSKGFLTNALHPVFQADLFNGQLFNAEDTLLARRLASRLLDADCSISFWWALMFGDTMLDETVEDREATAANIRMFTNEEADSAPLQEVENARQAMMQAKEPNHEMCLFDPPPCAFEPEALSTDQQTTTKAHLQLLAQNIRWTVEDDHRGARCVADWAKKASPGFRGSPSTLVISSQWLRKHYDMMRGGDLILQAWASISLAQLLLRMLSHAAVAAARSGAECNWTIKYHFDADEKPGAEFRMLESCTFGGVLRREQEREQVPKSHYTIDGAEGVPGLWIAFSDYASAGVMDGCGILEGSGYAPYECLPQESGPFYHREWQVPFSWLLKLLTDDFWDEDVRLRGQDALAPPKEVGYVMHRDYEKKGGPLHSREIRYGVIPAGYSMLPCSYVMMKDELGHEGRRHVLFGSFAEARSAPENTENDLVLDKYEEESFGSGSGSDGDDSVMGEVD